MEKINFYIEKYKLKELGELLGTGATTAVIKVSDKVNTSNIKDAVLHITREPQKFDYLSSLFKGSSLEIEKFDYNRVDCKYKEMFFLLKEEGLLLYFTTKMDPQREKEKMIVLNTAMDDVCIFFRKTRFNSDNLPVKNIMTRLIGVIDEFTIQINQSEQIILSAIERSLLAVSKTENLNDFKLDLHSGQFCSHNGELFCIDPIYFGESNN